MSDDSRPGLATLEAFYAAVHAQKGAKPQASRIAELLDQDVRKLAKKLGEEAVETALAAASGDTGDIIAESSDLLFRLLVLWAKLDVDPARVLAELAARHGPKTRGS
ncbi:MAG: phosphoribosyl-ATP diphosphatase [Alphaproteobacteria bacterium]